MIQIAAGDVSWSTETEVNSTAMNKLDSVTLVAKVELQTNW
jgi:hypothetical protein